MTMPIRFMKACAAIFILAASLAGCSDSNKGSGKPKPDSAEAAKADMMHRCGAVTASGYCGVQFDSPRANASKSFGAQLSAFGTVEQNGKPPACYMIFPKGRQNDIMFMVVDGKIVRVDIAVSGIKTEAGAEVGMSEKDVLARYAGKAKIVPNKYDARAHDITVAIGGTTRIIFETDGKTILRYRAGRQPAVGYVEGCG